MAAEAAKERPPGVQKTQRTPFSTPARVGRPFFAPKQQHRVLEWQENPCITRDGRTGLTLRVRVPFLFHFGALQRLKVHTTISLMGETQRNAKVVTITERPMWRAAERDVSADNDGPGDNIYDALRALASVVSHKGWAPNHIRRFYLQRLQGEEVRRFVRYEPGERFEGRALVPHRLVWAEDVSPDGLQEPDVNTPQADDSAASGSLASNPDADGLGGLVGAFSSASISPRADPVLDAAADGESAASSYMAKGGAFEPKIVFGKIQYCFRDGMAETSPMDVREAIKRAEGKHQRSTIFSAGQTLDEFEQLERIIRDSGATLSAEEALIDVGVIDLRHPHFLTINLRLDAKNEMTVLEASEHRGKVFVGDIFNLSEQRPDIRLSMVAAGRREIASLDPMMISAAQAVAKSPSGSSNPDPLYRFVCKKTIHNRRVYVDKNTKIKYTCSRYRFVDQPDAYSKTFGVQVHLDDFEGAPGCANLNDQLIHLLRAGFNLTRRFAEDPN